MGTCPNTSATPWRPRSLGGSGGSVFIGTSSTLEGKQLAWPNPGGIAPAGTVPKRYTQIQVASVLWVPVHPDTQCNRITNPEYAIQYKNIHQLEYAQRNTGSRETSKPHYLVYLVHVHQSNQISQTRLKAFDKPHGYAKDQSHKDESFVEWTEATGIKHTYTYTCEYSYTHTHSCVYSRTHMCACT